MRRTYKIYYIILYNVHIVCQITSFAVPFYAKKKGENL